MALREGFLARIVHSSGCTCTYTYCMSNCWACIYVLYIGSRRTAVTLQSRLKEKNIMASYASCLYSLLSDCDHKSCEKKSCLKGRTWNRVWYHAVAQKLNHVLACKAQLHCSLVNRMELLGFAIYQLLHCLAAILILCRQICTVAQPYTTTTCSTRRSQLHSRRRYPVKV